MLNKPFLDFYALSTGQSLPTVFAPILGISERTLRKSVDDIKERSIRNARINSVKSTRLWLASIGYSGEEIEAWLSSHPANSMRSAICSGLIYEFQADDVCRFPLSIEYARNVDELSTALWDARYKCDYVTFKEKIIRSKFVGSILSTIRDRCQIYGNNSHIFEKLQSADDWESMEEPWAILNREVILSVLAVWDVEFSSQYFSKFKPRSWFSIVLPKLDASAGRVGGELTNKKRDICRLPARRLIDFAACVGEFVHTGNWPDTKPKPRDIVCAIENVGGELSKQELTKLRVGGKTLKGRNFLRLWQQLCPRNAGRDIQLHDAVPWPMFVSAVFWQDWLSKVAVNKATWVSELERDYLYWWKSKFEELSTKGCAFGTSPWPDCLNDV